VNEQVQMESENQMQQTQLSNEEKMKRNLLNWALESLGVPSQSREETYVQVMEMGPGFAGESGAQFFKVGAATRKVRMRRISVTDRLLGHQSLRSPVCLRHQVN
jgi:hypothetical protein